MPADLLTFLRDLTVSQTVRKSLWVFPALECVHLYSMVLLVAVVATFDLRLMGVQLVREAPPLSKLSKQVVRLASVCFSLNFLTGVLLFASKAPDYYANSAFRLKILMLAAALGYHFVLFSRAARWETTPPRALASKLVGFASLAFWVAVIAASRWIAFV